jgi:hypothetical protein
MIEQHAHLYRAMLAPASSLPQFDHPSEEMDDDIMTI